MESTWRLCLQLFLSGGGILVFFFYPLLNSDPSNLLDCSHYSPWCTSKNRIQATSGRVFSDVDSSRRNHLMVVPHHPLDPLTFQEILRVRSVLFSHELFNSSSISSVHSLDLDEPEKSDVLEWKAGEPLLPRRAFVIAFSEGRSHLLWVDLGESRVIRHEVSSSSGYPMLTSQDLEVALSMPFADPQFNRTVLARGVLPSQVECVPLPAGWYGRYEEGRRLVKVQCFSREDTGNYYMRPIEGITAVVDIDAKKVVELTDHGVGIPIPKAQNTDYRYAAQTKTSSSPEMLPVNPISMEQPKGRSFIVEEGHRVKWANWEFHLKTDARAGVIVSRAMVRDEITGELRSVMYKGFLSELFVPYMDPTESWYFKAYLDAGEYGFGLCATPLNPLNDCPRHAYYMDGIFAAADGTPFVQSNMVCIFERYAGDVSWRHAEKSSREKIREARPKVTLVVRMAASVGNYDYIVDWEFQMDGLIHIKVGLSGMLLVKGTGYERVDQVAEDEDLFGTLVAENVIGVIHDHYLTFRLDMDVDAPENSFVKVHLEREETPPGSMRRSIIRANKRVVKTEKEAQIRLKLYDPSEFHVVNPSRRSHVGNPSGYKIVPGGTAASLLDPADPPQVRSAFTNNQIWVTRYNRSEQWAGGLLTYQSHGEDTLAVWSERDREIDNEDIVVWYTLGFHHLPCQEDFPIMPTVQSSFHLKPVNFFERNPILRTPPYVDGDLPVCRTVAST
ncbi:amine oxidase [copper-containing] gamma 2-like [Aristolochia californica]|uniref:amine oxidase [copper-containing] gamma 2-like n=1 Tax=Aristolochia californica TaxID=171875 RepID=UPI0035D8CBD9